MKSKSERKPRAVIDNRKYLHCDCGCGEIMAERVDNKIVIRRLRGKSVHFKVIDIEKEAERLDNKSVTTI